MGREGARRVVTTIDDLRLFMLGPERAYCSLLLLSDSVLKWGRGEVAGL